MIQPPRFSRWEIACLIAIGASLAAMFLFSCKGPARTILEAVTPPITGPKTPGPGTAPKTADDWRAEKARLLDLLDENHRANASLAQQIDAADNRANMAEKDAQQAEARTQAAWGRRIAFLCFALSVLVTILSFTPWGAILPKWAGPAGILAGIGILVAAQCWVWAFNHVLGLSIGAGCIGGVVALLALAKSGLLLRIRQTYASAIEAAHAAPTESKKLELTLHAKADALAAELKGGVHALGQRLRGKPVKTKDDVIALRTAAGTARLNAPELPEAPELMPTTVIVDKSDP